MKSLKLSLLFCASWAVLAAPATEQPELPRLSVRLTPHATGGTDSYMGVSETLSAPGLPAGGALVHLPIKLVGIPGSGLLDPGLTARDSSGPLAASPAPG